MKKKPAPKRKTAKKKTKKNAKPIAPPTDVQLAFELNQRYATILQAKQQISACFADIEKINKELQKRQIANMQKKKEA